MLHKIADASTVRIHQAKNEPLCPACFAWVKKLKPDAKAPEMVTVPAFEIAAAVFFRLQGKADKMGMSTVTELLIHLAQVEGAGVPRAHALRLEDAEHKKALEDEVVRMVKLGFENTAIARDLSARGMECSHEYVRRVRVARGLPTARQYRMQALDPRIKRLAEEGYTDAEIAEKLGTTESMVQERRAARGIKAGYRTPAYWKRRKADSNGEGHGDQSERVASGAA